MNLLMTNASGAANSESPKTPEIVRGNVTISASVSITYPAQLDKKIKDE